MRRKQSRVDQFQSHTTCGYDYLQVGGQKGCGTSFASPFVTTSTSLAITFKTDGSVTESGFRITVTVT